MVFGGFGGTLGGSGEVAGVQVKGENKCLTIIQNARKAIKDTGLALPS